MHSKEKLISLVLHEVQFNKTCHQKCMKKLKKIYESMDINVFWNTFLPCFKICLTVGQRHPKIENTLDFVAKFAVSFYSFSDDDTSEPMTPLLSRLFEFLLTHHSAKDKAVRFRICHFLNMLLNSMGEHAFIDDTLCNKITVTMMDRLLDKSAKVRAQAILALHRLQDPADDQCPVIKMFLFHVSKDPSAEVRKAVLISMGKNQRTLQAAVKRTRDVDQSVRKTAFEFISKVTVRSLTIMQRDQLISDGLKDRSEIVRKAVENVLLPSWLRHFKGDYIELLRALDVEIGTEAAVLALSTTLKNAAAKTLIEQLPISQDTKLIPVTKLTSENVLYWKCVVKHFHSNSLTEELELIIPELTPFCTYIRDFLNMMSNKQYESWEKHTQKFILLQLFEIVSVYDLSDEVGRKNLNELILYTLLTDHCSEKIIEYIVKHFEKVSPDVPTRLNSLAHVIGEIRMPSKEPEVVQVSAERQHDHNMQKAKLKVKILELQEEEYEAIQKKDYLQAASLKDQIAKLQEELNRLSVEPMEEQICEDADEEKNDAETMIKCLSIICAMLPVPSVTALTPTLRSLMSIVFESLDHPDDNVHILALKAIGIYCILDKELAKKHMMIFFLQFSLEQENDKIWVVALKAIFDLLLLYGLEYFEVCQNTDDSSTKTQSDKSRMVRLFTDTDEEQSSVTVTSKYNGDEGNCKFVTLLTELLDNVNQELRTVAAEGLCKLVINRRINSSSLVSRLIILLYSPANEGDIYIRQCLSSFFDHFVICVPEGQEMLEGAFLPTLQVLCNAPETSPLKEIDLYNVATFILSLTRDGIRKQDANTYCAHNNLAFAILAEVLNPNSKIHRAPLVKCLKNLRVQVDDETSKNNLLEACNKVLEMVKESEEKQLVKYVEHFKKRLENPEMVENVEDEDTENEE